MSENNSGLNDEHDDKVERSSVDEHEDGASRSLGHRYYASLYSKKSVQRIWTVLCSAALLVTVNVINFWVLSKFEFELDSVDLVRLFKDEYNLLPQFEVSTLPSLLRDAYSRKEKAYLRHLNTSSIVLKPRLLIDQTSVALTLVEGYYVRGFNNSARSSMEVSSTIREKSTKGRSFLRLFVVPFDLSSKYGDFVGLSSTVSSLTTGNWGIVAGCLALMSLWSCQKLAPMHKLPAELIKAAIGASFCVSTMTIALFTFHNVVIAAMIDMKLPNARSHFVVLGYTLQFAIAAMVTAANALQLKQYVQVWLRERDIGRQCKIFTASPTSSIYSPLERTRSMAGGFSSNSRKRPPTVLQSPDRVTPDVSNEKEDSLDPLYRRPDNLTRNDSKYSMLTGPARLRPMPSMKCTEDATPADSRSFSAPVFQYLGTGSGSTDNAASVKTSLELSALPAESRLQLESTGTTVQCDGG
ncbi:hypothetical protein ABC855_g939 [[Candida] zeylanoides]